MNVMEQAILMVRNTKKYGINISETNGYMSVFLLMKHWLFLLIIFSLISVSVSAARLSVVEPLVSPKWLNAHLNDPGLVVIDVRRGAASDFLKKGHIPGARLWDWQAKGSLVDLSGRVKNMPSMEDVTRVMRRLGVHKGDTVVFTTNSKDVGEVTYGTMAYWTLKYFGHENVAFLDGGTSHWVDKGYPLSYDNPTYSEGDFVTGKILANLMVSTDEMKIIVDDKTRTIIDFRPEPYYLGEKKKPFIERPGHIFGAINIPGDHLFDSHHSSNDDFPVYLTYKSPQEIRDLFGQNGIDLSKPSVAYCETGHLSSGGVYAVRELLGVKDMRWYHLSLKTWESEGHPAVTSTGK